MHTSNIHPADAGMYVLMFDPDGSTAVEFLPASATTALIHHAIQEEALLIASVLAVFVGRKGEGAATTEADAACRLHELVQYIWDDAVADGDPGYMEWSAPFSRHEEVDWRSFAQFVVGAAVSVCTPQQALATLAAYQLRLSDHCAGLSGVGAR